MALKGIEKAKWLIEDAMYKAPEQINLYDRLKEIAAALEEEEEERLPALKELIKMRETEPQKEKGLDDCTLADDWDRVARLEPTAPEPTAPEPTEQQKRNNAGCARGSVMWRNFYYGKDEQSKVDICNLKAQEPTAVEWLQSNISTIKQLQQVCDEQDAYLNSLSSALQKYIQTNGTVMQDQADHIAALEKRLDGGE